MQFEFLLLPQFGGLIHVGREDGPMMSGRIEGEAGVRLISSRLTAFTKRGLPLMMFAFLGLWTVLAAVREGLSTQFFVGAAFSAFVGYVVFRKSHIRNLADEVWDCGTELVIKRDGIEERVPLAEIANVGFSTFNPQRVTLTMRQPGVFGKEVIFIPPNQFLPWAKIPMVDELIGRVDAARRQ